MPKIFISYRRADSQYIADRIHDYMSMHFDDDNVFQDVGDIPFGVDFRAYLQKEIDKCDTVLVVIGPDWARIMQDRIDQTADFVRIEVEMALQKNKLVIPVLVNGANMPSPSSLPESIHQLCYNNAAKIRPNPDFKSDCERLANNIRQYHSKPIVASPSSDPTPEFEPPDLSGVLPEPFDWCFIPAGKVTLEAGGYVPEGGQTFAVASFYMAKYPITNAQYTRFIETGGYEIREYWTPMGWEIREKLGWTEQGVDKRLLSNHPVVGVSWYEAVAFCNWVSSLVANDKNAFANSLPSEQQWQRAAQGDDGRLYPWGNKFDVSNANVADSNINKTTPVTQFKNGASVYQVMDMVGNTGEWCLNQFEYLSQASGKITERGVIKGGSWGLPSSMTNAILRNAYELGNQNKSVSFRIVCNQ